MCQIRLTPDETLIASKELFDIAKNYEELNNRLYKVTSSLTSKWSDDKLYAMVNLIEKSNSEYENRIKPITDLAEFIKKVSEEYHISQEAMITRVNELFR